MNESPSDPSVNGSNHPHKESKLQVILVFVGAAALSGIIFSMITLVQKNSTPTPAQQQIEWEFRYRQDNALLEKEAEYICNIEEEIRSLQEDKNNQKINPLQRELVLHHRNYAFLAQQYGRHLETAIDAKILSAEDKRAKIPTLKEMKSHYCN